MDVLKNRILVYRLGSLGDTVMALPSFHKIRAVYPDSDITLLTNWPVATKAAPIEAVIGNDYFFDRILAYPVGTRNPLVLFSLIKEIRSLKIHTVINLTAPRSSTSIERDRWFFRAAGVKKMIGFPNNQPVSSVKKNQIEPEWEAKRLANRIAILGEIDLQSDKYWDLLLTKLEQGMAEKLFIHLSVTKPIIAISLGTKLQVNNWELSNWLTLLKNLRSYLPNWQLVVVGSMEEADVANQCLSSWGGMGVNLCGQASPRVSAAVLKKARVFVGHDSGPMHLAACVGTPCVAVFSARNLPGQWYPRGNFNQILYNRTDCAGCGLEVCIEQKKKCILSISVDQVTQAVLQVIQSDKPLVNSVNCNPD
jgi:heptosyltransferase III